VELPWLRSESAAKFITSDREQGRFANAVTLNNLRWRSDRGLEEECRGIDLPSRSRHKRCSVRSNWRGEGLSTSEDGKE